MKIAAGCFACLTLIFMVVSLGFYVAAAQLADAFNGVDADLGPTLFTALSYGSNGCCCLSGVLAVVLLAVGMSRGNNEAEE